jgi:hypothetical protein
VKAGAARLGLEAAAFAGHSLRAGFVTSAVSARVGLEHFKAAVASDVGDLDEVRAIVMPRRSSGIPARDCSESSFS